MKILVIYDNEGTIVAQRTGQPQPTPPVGIPYMLVDSEKIKGKVIKKVDVSKKDNHMLLLEDIPLTPQEKKINELESLVADLSQVVLGVK